MPQSIQGIVIALLISLLIGVIIGFYLRQGRINDLSNAVKQQKKRTEDIEQEHAKRLQEATLQLQKDYEQQLAEKIELYQTQYDQQVSELESEYDARLSMAGPAAAGVPPEGLGASIMAAGASANVIAIEQRIRKQYETRLKEAAQKIQQAYEQHLQLKLNESRDALQQDYERRLAEKIEHYQDQLDTQLAQLPETVGPMALSAGVGALTVEASTPRVNAGLSTSEQDRLETRLRQEYEQRLAEKIEHYQDDMYQRLQELEQEYEDRVGLIQAASSGASTPAEATPSQTQIADLERQLSLQIEDRLRAEYDQRLAETIERYQDEMVQRTQELEQEYESRLQLVHQSINEAPPTSPIGADPLAATEALLADSPLAAELSPVPEATPTASGNEPWPETDTIDSYPVENEIVPPAISMPEADTAAPAEADYTPSGTPFPGAEPLDDTTVESALFEEQSTPQGTSAEGTTDESFFAEEGIEVDNFDLGLESPPLDSSLEEDSIDFGIAEEGTTDGNPINNLDLGIDTSDLESPSNEGSIDLGTVGDDTVSEGGVEVDNLDLGIEIPSMESSPDEGSIDFVVSELESAPPPSGNSPQGNPLDLDDLLTLDEGENLVVEQPPMDDNSFDLDNLEDLLKEQENEEGSGGIFDDLDDLSNLS